jgi:aryl-alcohol dehydrogenase-like predicted oxidoreductase
LYQFHYWDGVTSAEETLRALETLVQSGKIRYFGTSDYTAWQMMKTLGTVDANKLMRPVNQQIYYTPESREAEFELLPMLLDQDIGTLIWGPLGEGLVTGTVRRNVRTPDTSRKGARTYLKGSPPISAISLLAPLQQWNGQTRTIGKGFSGRI